MWTLFFSLCFFSIFAECPAHSKESETHPPKATKLHIQDPWIRASNGKNGAAFLEIKNLQNVQESLLSVQSSVCQEVELHTHTHENGIMKMRPVKSIAITSGGKTRLQPGGLHIMLMGLHAPLKAGDHVDLVLHFQHAGQVPLHVPVKAMSYQPCKPCCAAYKNRPVLKIN